MRLNDLNDGSIKTLLILGLLFANIAVALPHRRLNSKPPGSTRDPSRDGEMSFAENASTAPASLASRARASRSFSHRPRP